MSKDRRVYTRQARRVNGGRFGIFPFFRPIDSSASARYKPAMLAGSQFPTALVYTLGAFALILLLARLRFPLAPAIFVGTAALAAAFGGGPGDFLYSAASGLVQSRTLALIVITILLLTLSETMLAGGQMKEIVSLVRVLLRRPAVAMAALPALVGLLPMPGGALFSAPMVAAAAGGKETRAAKLSAVNYWFRHIWEHWWPLYPGVLLAVTLTGKDLSAFIGVQFPQTVIMASAGLLIFRHTGGDLHARAAAAPAGTRKKLVSATSSIWLILLVWAVVRAAVAVVPGTGELSDDTRGLLTGYAPVALGLVVSVAWTVRLNRLDARRFIGILRKWSIWNLAILVASVMVFQYVLGELEAAERIGVELQQLRIPAILVVAVLPFIAGMVTGLAIGFVGTSFPIVLSIVAAMSGEPSVWPYVALAYGMGHIGQMMSPLHLCHVMSNQYFGTPFGPVYRQIVPSAVLQVVLLAGYFLLLRMVFG
ncbi:MAG: DUF401 family protein [Phycisphaerae bacterium]